MAELSALRARLKDRQVKEGALGTVELAVCLDQSAVLALHEAEGDLRRASAESALIGDPNSLAGATSTEVDTSEQQAKVDAAHAAVEESTIWLKFRGISSVRYQELVNQYEDPEAARAEFMNDLCEACLVEAWNGDDQVAGPGVVNGITWSEVHPELLFGEWDGITTQVFALNKRVLDAPFSRRPSKATKH